MQPLRLARPPAMGQREMRALAENIRHLGERDIGDAVRLVGDQGRDQPVAPRRDILPVEEALPLFAFPAVDAALAGAEQPRQPRPSGAVLRPDQQGRAVHQVEPTPCDKPHACLPFGPQPLDQPADRVAVRNAQRRIAEHCRRREQLLRAGDPAQEAEVRGHLKLDVGHANNPCMCQLRSPVASSSPSPRRKSQKRAPLSSSTWK